MTLSHDVRSALVKAQLRDFHGRWISMGFHVKFMDDGKDAVGKVVGIDHSMGAARVKVAEYDKHGNDLGITKVIDPKKLSVLNEVATLHFDKSGHADGVVKDAEPNTHVATKGIASHILQDKGEHPTQMMHSLDLPVGTQLYPLSVGALNKSPYNSKDAKSAAAIDHSSKSGLATVVKNPADKKWVILKDANGKEHAVAKAHFGVVRTEDRDKALIKSNDAAGYKGNWIEGLKADHTDLSHNGEHLPASESHDSVPKPEGKLSAEQSKATKVITLKNSDHSPVKTPTEDLKPGDQVYPISDSFGQNQYATIGAQGDATAKIDPLNQHGIGTVKEVKPNGDVKVQTAHGSTYTLKPGTNVVKRDAEKDALISGTHEGYADNVHPSKRWVDGISAPKAEEKAPEAPKAEAFDANGTSYTLHDQQLTKVEDLKPGDRVYPLNGAPMTGSYKNPYAMPTSAKEKAGTDTNVLGKHVSGEGTVVGDGPHGLLQVKGADGHEYSVPKASWAVKAIPETDKALADAAKGHDTTLQFGGAPEEPHAPAEAPHEDVHAPEAHEPAVAPHAPVEPVKENPFGDAPLVDKGKTIEDASGKALKVGHIVTHTKGKGQGVVTKVLPSTKSAWVQYESGEHKVASGHLLNLKEDAHADATAPKESSLPDKIGVGEVHFDTATNKMHIGDKSGKPIKAGDRVEYTKKGETKTGTVKGIYKGEKTVSIKFDDGTTSTKKASTLSKVEDDAKPEEPKVEAPHAEEPKSEEPMADWEKALMEGHDVAPISHADDTSHDGKKLKDLTDEQIKNAPVGSTLTHTNGTVGTKTEDGKWTSAKGNKLDDSKIIIGKNGPAGESHTFNLPKPEEPKAEEQHAPADEAPAPEPEAPSEPEVHGGPLGHGDSHPGAGEGGHPAGEGLPEAEGHGDGAASDDLTSFHGQTFDKLPADKISDLPVGAKLVAANGAYRQKMADNEWRTFKKDGSYLLTSTNDDADIKSIHTNVGDGYTLEVPGHGAPEETEAPSIPDTHEETASVSKLTDLSPAQIDGLPVGSKMVHENGMEIMKQADGTWTTHGVGNVSHAPIGIDPHDVKNGPMADKYHVEVPAAAGHAAPGDTLKPGASLADASLEDIKNAPVGSKFTHESGLSIQKTGADQWSVYKADGSLFPGIKYDDEGVQLLKDSDHSSEYHFSAPVEAPSTPSAPESALKPGIAESVGKSMIDVPGNIKPEDFPVGTVLKANEGGTLTKTSDSEWHHVESSGKPDPTPFWNEDVHELTEFNPGWTVHSVPGVSAPESSPTEPEHAETKEMKFKDYAGKMEDLPVGTKVSHEFGTGYYEKTGPNTWTGKDKETGAANGLSDDDEGIKGFGGQSNLVKMTIPGGVPSSQDGSFEGKASDWGKSLSEAPVGTKITQPGWTKYYEKVGYDTPLGADGAWELKNSDGEEVGHSGDDWLDQNMNNSEYNLSVPAHTAPAEHIAPIPQESAAPGVAPIEGQTLKDIKPADIAEAPVGAKISYKGAGSSGEYTKIDKGKWKYKPEGAAHPTNAVVFDKTFEHLVGSDAGSSYTFGAHTPDEAPSNIEKGVKLNTNLLDSYPAGTTIKQEAYGQNQYYWQKQPDGTWNEYKKTDQKLLKGKQGASSHEAMSQGGFSGYHSTAVVSKPKDETAFAMGTGEHAHVGDSVTHEGQQGTVHKILSNSAKVKFGDGSTKNVKFQDLKGTGPMSYGTKSNASYGADPATASHQHFESIQLTKAETSAFAGADASHYDEQGLHMPADPAPNTFSGLTAVKSGPVDESSPLHGAPMPTEPTPPSAYPAFQPHDLQELPKWDSGEWLKAVEQRYLDNPYKAQDSVQKSNNWSQIQSVLNGDKIHLQQLLDSKYIDQKMFDDAVKGIDEQDKSNEAIKQANLAKEAAQKQEYEAAKAAHTANYQKELADFNDKLAQWMQANPSPDAVKIAEIPPTSQENFTGGPADWSKAHVGTHTAQTVIDSISKDNVLAKHGLSFAVDSDQIENLNVKATRVIDKGGKQVMEYKFKLTAPYGKILEQKLKVQNGVETSDQIYPTRYTTDLSTGLLKESGKPNSNFVNDGKRYTYLDEATGAKVLLQRSSYDEGLNVDSNNNSIKIHMPVGSTAEDFQKTLENMGIVNARPSTEGDIRVLAENRLISLAGKKASVGGILPQDATKNMTGEERASQLAQIEADYGLTPDDMTFKVEPNGRVTFFLPDEKADQLAQKWGVGSWQHQLSGGSDMNMWENMLAGATPGLQSTYHRFTEGIGGEGASSSADMQSGAGDYVYVTPYKGTEAKGSYTVVMKPSAVLKRTDYWANESDNWGKKGHSDQTPFRKFDAHYNQGAQSIGYETYAMYEILPHDTIPLSDWSHVKVPTSTRDAILKMLEKKGVTQINGIPVGNFIISPGMTPPQY